MESLVLSIDALPPLIREKFNTPKVSVQELDGRIILMPVREKPASLWGLLSDGKLSSEKFLEQKRRDKELEQ